MEHCGLVHREVHQQVPPKVEYSLTEFGQSLNAALIPLGDWGEKHMKTIEAIQASETAAAVRPVRPAPTPRRSPRPGVNLDSGCAIGT